MVVTDTRAGKPISFSRARAKVERDYADSRSKEWLADAKKGLTVEVLWEGLKVR